MRGDGFLYQRGAVWWYGYCRNGVFQRESLGTTDAKAAERKAKGLRDGLISGSLPALPQRRVTVGELLDDLWAHLETRERASRFRSKSHMKPLRQAFGELQAGRLETAAVERYQKARKELGRAPATINRELELLRQAYRLAWMRAPRKVQGVPLIPLLPVDNARQGFLSRAEVLPILKAIANPDVRDFLEWFWWTGMRPSEIRRLTWEMLNRETWTLHLAPQAAKTKKGRTIPLLGPKGAATPLLAIVKRRLRARRIGTPLIFHRVSKGKAGRPVEDVRKAWRAALKAAGVSADLRPYDLRRTALRNMLRGGTDVAVAMRISGHRTRATFDRYNITSEEDVSAAVARTVAYVESLPKNRKLSQLSHIRRR